MGKNRQCSNLGKTIIKDRFKKVKRPIGDATVHTTDLDDGYEWARLNLQSITERSTLDDFLATAEMAGTEFTAERQNVHIVQSDISKPLLTSDQRKAIAESQDTHRSLLKIPRRPKWDKSTTASELDLNERESFLDWRKKLAELQDMENIMMTPFEKNLDFWRQLWRVIERSDVVVQIVDARNPLLFRCSDLDEYVKEVGSNKKCALLINKADHLTSEQRTLWAQYFDNLNIRAIFWSAVAETERQENAKKEARQVEILQTAIQKENCVENDINELLPKEVQSDEEDSEDEDEGEDEGEDGDEDKDEETKDNGDAVRISNLSHQFSECVSVNGKPLVTQDQNMKYVMPETNSSAILTGIELVAAFKSLYPRSTDDSVTTIGLVGYPNVGKSSTINAILEAKKCPVSATPGRTKHFQTLYVDPEVMLCDCPGLVMPSFVSTKAEMVCNGILPIDQLRDSIAPIGYVCESMGRQLLEQCYGVMIVKPGEGEDPNRPPTPHELLSSYACMRGFMTHKGIPDYPRAARLILKDFVNGKLLFPYPVPGCDPGIFKPSALVDKQHKMELTTIGTKVKCLSGKKIDQEYIEFRENVSIGSKGVTGGPGQYKWLQAQRGGEVNNVSAQAARTNKKHHNNRSKKEKLRRQFGHMDA